MLKNKTFCIKPWTSSVVCTNGDIAMCCSSTEERKYNLRTSTIEDYWNSQELAEVRKKMLLGETVESCQYCYVQENNGITSPRQKANSEYSILENYADKILKHYDYPKALPVELELQLTNLCNLKCLMCNEKESSSIATENKLLKISRIDQKDYEVHNPEIKEIKNWLKTAPRLINLRGGEPTMVPEIKKLLTWALDNKLLDNTEVHLTTNATTLTENWLNILSNIPKLRMMISIDATGSLGEYIRHNSVWATVENNVKTLSKIPGINLIIHATILNLNILHIDKLIAWARENNYYLSIYPLAEPEIFRAYNMPPELLQESKNKLVKLSDPIADTIVTALNKQPAFDNQLWQDFCKEIAIRDTIRNVSILNVLPELKDYYAKKA